MSLIYILPLSFFSGLAGSDKNSSGCNNRLSEHIEAKTKMTSEGGLHEDLVDVLLKLQDKGSDV